MSEQEQNTKEMQCPICRSKTTLTNQRFGGGFHYSKWPCSNCGGWFDFDPAHETKVEASLVIEPLPETQRAIAIVCDEIKLMLLEKNRKYGNSALNPKRVFSKACPREQLKVRIDDKLSRIDTSGLEDEDEDTVLDLIGYLILFRVATREV